MSKKVLVTGATGRIGSVVVRKLVERGYEVRAFVLPGDPFTDRFSDTGCEIFTGDLMNQEDVKAALEGCQLVAHLAALMTKPASMDETTYIEKNVKASWNITRCAKAAGIERMLCASSDAYYPAGTERLSPIYEDAVSTPKYGSNYLYSLTKRLIEEIVWEAYRESGYKFEVTVVRYGSVLHHDEMLSFMHAKTVKGFLGGSAKNPSNNTYRADVPEPDRLVKDIPDDKLIIPYGPDGRSWRIHLTHAEDAAEGTVLALLSPNAAGEAFNILGPESTVREQAVKYIHELTGIEYEEVHLDTFWEFECSIEKARKLLGYDPKYDTKKLVEDAVEWRKKGFNTVHQLNSADF